jgi:exopolyphosphatase / guanosine-5'-triphosphate,3'-diphosphate pyrophosphatase
MAEFSTLAAVDLGSNSFHCQVARVVGDQIYTLDSLREPVRLGAGLSEDKMLEPAAQERALAALRRFGERLRGLDRHAIRAVGTNTLRVAKNAPAFIRLATVALGSPVEVIAGREEARLIFIGVQHSLPPSKERRLVIDIGGGSTEFIIGSGFKPFRLASLFMGCVSYSRKYFPGGVVTRSAMKEAELAARNELQPLLAAFGSSHWQQAVGSSGTVRALAELSQENASADGAITRQAIEKLRSTLIRAGSVEGMHVAGLRADRVPVIPGGLAILNAVLSELDIEELTPATGAMRQGLLYDLLGRVHHHDMRDITVAQFMQRYHVDAGQARRVGMLAQSLYRKLTVDATDADENDPTYLGWAAKLHEIGISVAYSGYHKHSAYILENADMPGFSRDEQTQVALLVLSHRRSLKKVQARIEGTADLRAVLALRLAVIFYRARTDISLPTIQAKYTGARFRVSLDRNWLARNTLTAAALREEMREWQKIGFELKIPELDPASATDAAVPVS